MQTKNINKLLACSVILTGVTITTLLTSCNKKPRLIIEGSSYVTGIVNEEMTPELFTCKTSNGKVVDDAIYYITFGILPEGIQLKNDMNGGAILSGTPATNAYGDYFFWIDVRSDKHSKLNGDIEIEFVVANSSNLFVRYSLGSTTGVGYGLLDDTIIGQNLKGWILHTKKDSEVPFLANQGEGAYLQSSGFMFGYRHSSQVPLSDVPGGATGEGTTIGADVGWGQWTEFIYKATTESGPKTWGENVSTGISEISSIYDAPSNTYMTTIDVDFVVTNYQKLGNNFTNGISNIYLERPAILS